MTTAPINTPIPLPLTALLTLLPYQDVCNGFRAVHTLRPDQGRLTYDTVLQDEAQDILRAYLDSPEPPIRSGPADDANWALLRTAWTSCNDVDAVRAAGAKPIVELLEKVQAALPLKAATTATSYGDSGAGGPASDVITLADAKALAAAQIILEEIGITSLASIGVAVDDKKPVGRAPTPLELPLEYMMPGRCLLSSLV